MKLSAEWGGDALKLDDHLFPPSLVSRVLLTIPLTTVPPQ